jgi:hypothetical protein
MLERRRCAIPGERDFQNFEVAEAHKAMNESGATVIEGCFFG